MVGMNGRQNSVYVVTPHARRFLQAYVFVAGGMWPPPRHTAAIHDRGSTYRQGKEKSVTQGTVKWFNPIKGIGFLSVDGGEQDVFVHFSAIETDDVRSLDENRRVEFDIIQNEQTRRAAHVRYV
jgi:cold shock protein